MLPASDAKARAWMVAREQVYLEVVKEVDLGLCVHLHLVHRNDPGVDAVDHLAVDDPACEVLDLAEPRVEVLSDPIDQLLPAHEVPFMHHPCEIGSRVTRHARR